MPADPPAPIGLYVHVPFCASKCGYCDFASWAGRQAEIPRYLDAVLAEIVRRGEETAHPAAATVFVGGGTPSLLTATQATRILAALRASFALAPTAEITFECNPGTLTSAWAGALRAAGVNRLSLGAQAAPERLLRILGRRHTWTEVERSAELARAAGFENVNYDLMFGLPTQTLAEMRATLEASLSLNPTHLSCYGLSVEERTPLCGEIAAGRLALPPEEAERAMYELIRETLAAHGLEQYEISNFARPGYACRHNIGCWTRVPYLGFGPAAHSFFGERRLANPPSLDDYLAGEAPRVELLSPADARFESLMLGLRMTAGVRDDDFARAHGIGIGEAFGAKLDGPLAAGLLEWHAGALRLTRAGMDLQNQVLVELL